ncbi:MAG: ATP-grasp fold amidoligase family protein [Eubacteriales bacterium]|nr:ATP-grasp fold amidoligase family protein [Eubacteriales bacterium]
MSMKDVLKNPALVFLTLGHRGFFNWMSDDLYLKISYRIRTGKKLNLSDPKTYNEKLQWIKINDRCSDYTTMVDKYDVKQCVSDIIGEEYIIPTLGVWDKFEDIDFDKLPNQFVIKCTHNSGGVVICRDKSKFDVNKARKTINKCLKNNFYWAQREWPYKNVIPRIIAEKYMEVTGSEDLPDYKFFAFDGEVKALFIATDRYTPGEETKFDFFDENFKHLDFTNGHPNAKVMPQKPGKFEEMKELASKLSKGIPQLRVDFYEVDGKVYFGEITFFHWSGMTPFVPEKWDYTFGEWISLD